MTGASHPSQPIRRNDHERICEVQQRDAEDAHSLATVADGVGGRKHGRTTVLLASRGVTTNGTELYAKDILS